MNKLDLKPCSVEDTITFTNIEHTSPFQCEIDVRKDHASNEVNHINNIQYIKWIDRGAELHCDASGWTRDRMLKDGIMWFVARHEIDYIAEATSADRLRLTTWIEDIRRVKSWRNTIIHALDNTHREVCRCKTLWVLVNLKTRRSTSIPIKMANALNPIHKPRTTRT